MCCFLCVYVVGYSQNYSIYSLIYIKLYTIQVSSGIARGEQEERSPKPGKFAKDGEQPAPQPAVNLESNKNFKFLLTFLKILLKFSKTFKFFLKQLSKLSIKLSKFLQIFFTIFSQNTVTFLIYSKCLTFSQKY